MKTVLITGGSRGIGAELVRQFSRAGYAVAFVYRSSHDAANALTQETGAFPIVCDVAVEEDAIAAVRRAHELLGHIDVLINNAAVAGSCLFTDITSEEWHRFFGVNLDGVFYFSREVLRPMIARKSGKIINIASMWGEVGASCEVHYSATKAAVIGLTRALAKEVGPSGITVNCISPGFIDTEMNGAIGEDTRAALVDETPLSRVGTTADVAAAALYLASDGADFVTGQVLSVNGGLVI